MSEEVSINAGHILARSFELTTLNTVHHLDTLRPQAFSTLPSIFIQPLST